MKELNTRGRRGAPQHIDFVVFRGRVSGDTRTVSRKRLMHMQMHGSGHRLALKIFPRVNVVKRRLQESPQERGNTENDAADSHSFT